MPAVGIVVRGPASLRANPQFSSVPIPFAILTDGATNRNSGAVTGVTTVASPAGNNIVAAISAIGSAGLDSISSLLDSAGNHYTFLAKSFVNFDIEFWVCPNALALPVGSTFTAVTSRAGQYSLNVAASILGYNGGFDATGAGTVAAGTTLTATTGTTTQTMELAFAGINGLGTGTYAEDPEWIQLAVNPNASNGLAWRWLRDIGTTSWSPHFNSSSCDGLVITLKQSVLTTAWEGSAALTGAGSVIVLENQLFVSVASLTGAGALVSNAIPESFANAALAGAGAITVNEDQLFVSAAALTGAGALVGDALPPLQFASAALIGAGAVSGTAVQVDAALTTLAGAGAIAGTAVQVDIALAALAGAGALVANGIPEQFGNAALAGAGAIAATAVQVDIGLATLAGAGLLVEGDTGPQQYASAALAGVGATLVAALQTDAALATLAGSGAEASAAFELEVARSTLAGAGSLVGNSLPPAQIDTGEALAGAGLITSGMIQIELAAAALAGVGTINGQAFGTSPSANWAGVGTILSKAFIRELGLANLAGAGLLVEGDPGPQSFALATFTGSGIIVSAAILQEVARANLAGAGALSEGDFGPQQYASAVLAGTGTVAPPKSPLIVLANPVSMPGNGIAAATCQLQILLSATFAGLGNLNESLDFELLTARASFRGVGRFVSDTVQIFGTSRLPSEGFVSLLPPRRQAVEIPARSTVTRLVARKQVSELPTSRTQTSVLPPRRMVS